MQKVIVRNVTTRFGIEIRFPELVEVPGEGSETVRRAAWSLYSATVKAAKRILFEQGAREVEVLYFGEAEVIKSFFLPKIRKEDFGENGLLNSAHYRSGSGLASAGWGMVAQPYPEFGMNGYGEMDGKVSRIWMAEPWMVFGEQGLKDIREK